MTGQVTAVMNTPVNATIIVMAVTDHLTQTVKSVLNTLASRMVNVSATLGGLAKAVNSGQDHVTQSVMAVSAHLLMSAGTVLTTLSVMARRVIMKDMMPKKTEVVAVMQTGVLKQIVVNIMVPVTPTVESTQVSEKDH